MSYRFTLPALCLIAPAALAQSTITESFASPFTRVATQEPAGVASVAFDASAHELLKPAFDRGDMVRLEGFALPNSQVDLVLRPVSAMESGATAIVMNPDGVERMAPSAAIFQGHVDGLPSGQSSTVFLSVSRTQLNGYVSIDGELVFVSNGMNESPGRAWVTEASALPSGASNSSWCQSINQMVAPSGPATQLGAAGPDVHIGDFYLELDEEFGDLFSSSQDAIDYATTLITATSEVYRRDLGSVINIPNGYMRLWNTTPPWGVTSSFGGLDPFVDWWNSSANPDIDLPRAGVHLLTNPVFGGVAYLPALCDMDFGYALSSVFGFFPYPIQHTDADNWDLFVVSHEWGHNHGSPHTFDYFPAFDACTDGTGPDSGTIMSYCHLEAGGTANVGMRFHPEVQTEMRAYIETVTCLDVQPVTLGDYDYDGDRDASDLAALDAYLVQGFASAGAQETFDMNQDGVADACDRDILNAIVNVAAPSAMAYNGSGSNPSAYSSLSAPAIGTTWTAEIDASGSAGATLGFILGYSAPTSGGIFPFGELLIDLASTAQFTISAPVSGGTASFSLPIGNNKAFVGFTSYSQGVIFGSGSQLTNGLELFVNFQ